MSYEYGAWQAAEANYADAMTALNQANADMRHMNRVVRERNARIEELGEQAERLKNAVSERDAIIASLEKEAEARATDLARSRSMAAGHLEAASALSKSGRSSAFAALPATADMPARPAVAQCWMSAHAKVASGTPNIQIHRSEEIAADLPWLFPDEAARVAFKQGVRDVATRKQREVEEARLKAERAAEAARLKEERHQAALAATLQEANDRAAARKAAKEEAERASGLDKLLPLIKGRSPAELRGIQASLASEPRKGFMSRKWSVLGVTYATEDQAIIARNALHLRLQQIINCGF